MTTPSTTLRSRAWVEADLGALCANALEVQHAAGPDVGLIPMVKADAYGLGMQAVAAALRDAIPPEQLWAFGVAATAEGEGLRASGWSGRILVFSPILPSEYSRAADARLTLCLSELDAVRRWADAARAAGHPLAFHTEVDTGMGRAGFAWSEAGEWGAEVARISGELLCWEGCFTHFHSADEPDIGTADLQWQRFQQALGELPPEPHDAPRRIIHVANSAAALRRAGYGCDLVRPGVYMYGGCAGPGVQPMPVASVRARVALVREVPPGTTVGYGATYSATARERWGTLAIGYGDGIPRVLGPAGGSAIVRGRRVPIIGRISMDVTVVDLSSVPEAVAGDVATLIGRDGAEEIPLDEVASLCGTISYEILTGLAQRLPRVYSARGAS